MKSSESTGQMPIVSAPIISRSRSKTLTSDDDKSGDDKSFSSALDDYNANQEEKGSDVNQAACLPEVVESKQAQKASAPLEKIEDQSDDSDYSLKSSYDAEVAYRHESDEEKKQTKLNQLHQKAAKKLNKKR